ncbi:MAG: Ribosomal small subunit methyltransferase [Pseudomonadota bacterium]|jgi:16S rRNA (guanine527-N7)-methyltransferase
MSYLDVQAPALVRQSAEEWGFYLSDAQIEDMVTYLRMLQKWGKVYNLTAVLEDEAVVVKHLLDSLATAVSVYRKTEGSAQQILDVGSGGGLPGVVWALANPRWSVTCVDTVSKKTAFIQQVANSLKGSLQGRLQVEHARVEALQGQYSLITSRAFASLPDFVSATEHLLAVDGFWAAMKGKKPDAEIQELPATVQVFHVEPIEVPMLSEERCLVWIGRR